MKSIPLTIAALTFSATALADISSGNPDLYGWIVEDQRLLSVEKREYAHVKSPFGDNPDQYGGVLADKAPAYRNTATAPGIGDSYGSVLHDVGFSF